MGLPERLCVAPETEIAVRRTSQVIATASALSAFSVALLSGAAAGNEPSTVLMTGLAVLFGGYLVGLAIGAVGARAVDEHIAQYAEANPTPPIDGAVLHVESDSSLGRSVEKS